MKRWWVLGTFLMILAGVGWQFRSTLRDLLFEVSRPELPRAVSFEEIERSRDQEIGETQNPKPKTEESGEETSPTVSPTPPEGERQEGVDQVPNAVNLAVPFTSQAPHQVWDAVHEETCEEASILMVDAFFDGRELGGPDSVERELQELVAWQRERFGYFEDTTAEETAIIAREFYGYERVEVRYDVTTEDMRDVLAAGLPIIVPAYGRALGNLFYTPPGPDYHMFVIRGYTRDGRFITNDVGTRRGEAYVYDPEVLWKAIHDWNGGDVLGGRKVMIVVHPNE